jgi:hypothetical protein
VAKLTPTPGHEAAFFGQAVAISAETILVGAHLDDGVAADSGLAYVFRPVTGFTWAQTLILAASDADATDMLGGSVGIEGNRGLVGARFADSLVSQPAVPDAGAVYVFDLLTSADCDCNGTADSCDIANCPPEDPSCQDCDGDGVMNECEAVGDYCETDADCDDGFVCTFDECDPTDCSCHYVVVDPCCEPTGICPCSIGCEVWGFCCDPNTDTCQPPPCQPCVFSDRVCPCGTAEVDADIDGVFDCIDCCPNSPPSLPVDENGCPFQGACLTDQGSICLDGLSESQCEQLPDGAYAGNGSECNGPPRVCRVGPGKNRYVSIGGLNPGRLGAIQVQIAALHHVCSAASLAGGQRCTDDSMCPLGFCDTSRFAALEGQIRYVNAVKMCRGGGETGSTTCETQADCDARAMGGTCEQAHTCQGGSETGGVLCGDQAVCDSRGRGGLCRPSLVCPEATGADPTFRCATLACPPEYRDWGAELMGEPLHITGAGVIPGYSVYWVRQLDASCAGQEGTCTSVSDPRPIFTAQWGNVDDLDQLNVIDLSSVTDKVKELSTALPKSRTQLRPNDPNPYENVNVLDIANVTDALKGIAYPFAGPQPCPQ